MIEAYAFLAVFAVQILAMSVLYPTWFTRYVRAQAKSFPPEYLAQMYPGVDLELARKRFLTRYRTLNLCIASLGLLLLGWLFSYMRGPGWDDDRVGILVTLYFMVQMVLPLGLMIWLGLKFNKDHRRDVPESRRKANLQRRGLFDFVSPVTVSLAVLSYFLFAAYVIYLRQHPFLGFAGLVNIVGITLVYAVNAFTVYAMLYGKKPNPFEPHEGRVRTIGLVVKSSVYSCIACVAFLSIYLTLALLEWQSWEPFAMSAFFVVTGLLSLMGMTAAPRKPGAGADGLGPGEQLLGSRLDA